MNHRPFMQPDWPEDLLILERRAELSEPAQRRLQMCLAASDGLQVLRQVGHAFDAMPTEAASDAAFTAQLVANVTAQYAPQLAMLATAKKCRWAAYALWAAALFMTLGAAAAFVPLRKMMGHAISHARVSSATRLTTTLRGVTNGSTRRRDAPATQVPGSSALPAPDEPPVEWRPAVAPTRSIARATTRDHETTSAVEPKGQGSPADLFSGANAQRRQGRVMQASDTYRRLQQQFPRSDEARLSYVLLARLDMTRGATTQALNEFNDYLQQAPGGSLEQEALQGKAQALGRLGRLQEKQAVLRELLARFPNSVYAPSAREQLGDDP